MTRANKIPVCSLVDFYQCIPDYEDVMHLPSHELDERLRDLRSMQKSYLDGRASPLFTSDFRSDYGYLREDYRDFMFPESESCPRQCPYTNPVCFSFSKHDSKLTGTATFESSSTGRECTSTPFPKDSVTTPSTLSNKSSKSAFSNGYDIPFKPTNRPKRKKNSHLKTERASWSKPSSYFYSLPQYRSGSPSFREDFACDEIYGASWTEGLPPNVPKEQRSLPCSPVHRRSAKHINADKQRRSRLLSYLSTPDVRVPEEKPSYVFRAQPFPSHIFSNYLNKRREERLNHRADSRKKRAEELQKTSSFPPSMRRRQKVNTITIQSEHPKSGDDSERSRSGTSPNRFRYKGLSPYRKVERRSSSNTRRSRLTSVEARDNLASLLRLQASRRKLEAASIAAAEMAAAHAGRRMRARATRLSPVWHSALSRPTTDEDLMLKAARRREEAAEKKRRRRRAVAAMRERVRAAPSLMERQSFINGTASSLGGFSYRDSGLKSAKHSTRLRRPTTADALRCYSNNHNDYIRSHTQISSYPPKRRPSRVVISNKNSFSDDEVQRQCQNNSKPRRKQSFTYQTDLREIYYDPPENDSNSNYRKQRSRPTSPVKSRSSVNHTPNYGSPEGDHSGDFTDEEPLMSHSRHSPSFNVNAGGRNSRVDLGFSDSHGEDSQIPQEHSQNELFELRESGQTYSSNERKHAEQPNEASYSKSVSRDEFATFGFGSTKTSPPFWKSETWPTNPAKESDNYNRSLSLGYYENRQMEAITKRFEDVSLKCSSPMHEREIETNFDETGRNEQPCFNHCRSTQSSPQLRRRGLYHDFKTIHDSIPGLDLASQRQYFNEDNLRYNIRSPKRHLIQSKSVELTRHRLDRQEL